MKYKIVGARLFFTKRFSVLLSVLLFSFKDSHTDSGGILHVDKRQDFRLLRAHTSGYHVNLEFSRDFDTCDPDDYQFDVICFIK